MAAMLALIAIVLIVGKIAYNQFRAKDVPSTSPASETEKVSPSANPTPAKTPVPPPSAVAYPEWKPSVAGTTKIPLVPELTIITAIAHPTAGDYESIKRIQAVRDDAVAIAYSSDIPGAEPSANNSAAPPRKKCIRTVRRQDLRNATQYHENFCAANEESYPGTTAISISTQTLADLKSKGEAPFKYQSTENAGDPDRTCILKRVEAADVAIPVLVNNRREQLPAVHARCSTGEFELPSDFYFLDDADNPLSLAWQLASSNKVVKITIPTDTPQIEQSLEQTGRAEVYGIYFDFASASIRPESEPVLEEIADALQRNPSWKLSIEGHTDKIGNDAYNLGLSDRRAAAVKQALAERYKIAGSRLTTAGFGASRPKEPNDTLEGRARNRRVELVRQPS